MSLEQAITENTAAIKQLIAVMSSGAQNVVAADTKVSALDIEPTPKFIEKEVKAKAAKASKATAENQHGDKALDPATGAPSSEVPYADVQTATLALSKAKGGDAVRAILADFKVDHAKKLEVKDYASYIEKCKAAMAVEEELA